LIIHEIACFWSIRALLGPLIESLILFDKVLFLKEDEKIENVDLFRIFDEKLSPRNFVLVAVKK
jgi:hypothetical protein